MLCLHEHRKFIYTGSNIIEGTNIFLPYLIVDGAYQYKMIFVLDVRFIA